MVSIDFKQNKIVNKKIFSFSNGIIGRKTYSFKALEKIQRAVF